jgi:SH3-like domain-containing protein
MNKTRSFIVAAAIACASLASSYAAAATPAAHTPISALRSPLVRKHRCVTNTAVVLKKSPRQNARVIGSLDANVQVGRFGNNGNWLLIGFRRIKGWVPASSVTCTEK